MDNPITGKTMDRAGRRRIERELEQHIRDQLRKQFEDKKNVYTKKEMIDMLTAIQKQTMLQTMEIALDAVSETKGIGEKRFAEIYERIAVKLR